MLKKKETRGRDLIFSIQAAADRDNMYIKNQLWRSNPHCNKEINERPDCNQICIRCGVI